ncbi:MAG: hypothetical protein EKK57_05060 [Proteobacteria bacterium]|nr:MAG: hypothetical protein EKK57_05060 [Pseudomonadota bacterium]
MNKTIHIALDFDKTLSQYESSWKARKVGTPIQPMVENVKRWLSKGYKVSIFTARVATMDSIELYSQREMITNFLKDAGLPELPITAQKLKSFTHFIDDKAFHVVPNTGEILNCPEELL